MRLKKSIFFAACGLAYTSIYAQDVPEGTVLNAGSVDELKNKTFEGKKIADLLLPSQERAIKEFGLQMVLRPHRPIAHHPLLLENTEKFASQATLDEAKRTPVGFVSGMPFPNLDPKDKWAGTKLAFNFMWAPWYGDYAVHDPMPLVSIDPNRGMEREILAHWDRIMLMGRLREPYSMDYPGASSQVSKVEAFLFKSPEDLKGIGTISTQYADGRLPDLYAYIKAVRRIRRLSSGGWADPIAAIDFLNDESFALNADPRWYEAWNLKEKRWILGSPHAISPGIQLNERDPNKRYPTLNFASKPFGGLKEEYEPREVWVVETIMPKTHLNSKKIQHFEADPYSPELYWQEMYDRKGEFWRTMECHYQDKKGGDGYPVPVVAGCFVPDYQRFHLTIMYNSKDYINNVQNFNINDFTPQGLTRLIQ